MRGAGGLVGQEGWTCLAKTAMSSLKESEEQTSPPATPGSRGVQVASSHFSKTRANRGNNGCLTGSATQRHTHGDGCRGEGARTVINKFGGFGFLPYHHRHAPHFTTLPSGSRAWARNRKEERPGPGPQLRTRLDVVGAAPGHFSPPSINSLGSNVRKHPIS